MNSDARQDSPREASGVIPGDSCWCIVFATHEPTRDVETPAGGQPARPAAVTTFTTRQILFFSGAKLIISFLASIAFAEAAISPQKNRKRKQTFNSKVEEKVMRGKGGEGAERERN